MTTERADLRRAEARAARSTSPGRIYLIIGAAILYGVLIAVMMAIASG